VTTRRWIRKGRVYRLFAGDVQSIIFGAEGDISMWAWGVWASKSTAEGIEFSLKRAKQCANEALDKVGVSA
jgi:hypothetical protein